MKVGGSLGRGTNAEQGKQILADSGLTLEPADSLAEAVEKIVQLAAQASRKEEFQMSVLVNKDSLRGSGDHRSAGSFHTTQCMECSTSVVAGVTPGKGGQKFQDSVPVFDTVREAVDKEGTSVRPLRALLSPEIPFSKPLMRKSGSLRSPRVSVRDMAEAKAQLGCLELPIDWAELSGIITPGECKIGIMRIHSQARKSGDRFPFGYFDL